MKRWIRKLNITSKHSPYCSIVTFLYFRGFLVPKVQLQLSSLIVFKTPQCVDFTESIFNSKVYFYKHILVKGPFWNGNVTGFKWNQLNRSKSRKKASTQETITLFSIMIIIISFLPKHTIT